jgi:hypothetical protein
MNIEKALNHSIKIYETARFNEEDVTDSMEALFILAAEVKRLRNMMSLACLSCVTDFSIEDERLKGDN